MKFIALLRCQVLHKKAQLQFSVPFNYLCFWALSIGNSIYSLKLLFSWVPHPYLSLYFSFCVFLKIFFLLFDVVTERVWPLWCSPARTASAVVLPFYIPLFGSWLFHMSPPKSFCLLGLLYLTFYLFVSLAWKLFHTQRVWGQHLICRKVKPLHIFCYFSRVWPNLEQCTDCREHWKFSLKPKLKNSRGILIYKKIISRLHEAMWLVAAICTNSNSFRT